ncbi:dioxygenase family protein [Pseudonocardia dioxanivorans]|uniref:dioxygenase family protein n=1 Tax=Pseudonocardia dioxanivorans TaxID=240495 RepID=UPI000CD1BB7B|nr:dioxygenase [Pseudonocardia dioxanivorans]
MHDHVVDGRRLGAGAPGASGGGELFSEARSVEVVAASFAATPDARLRHVMTSLVEHLHGFVKDVRLTKAEWATAIRFLTETGHMCSDTRQEFILLSDVLGISMLVETLATPSDGVLTESTVEGPFHMVDSPGRELGACISGPADGDPCLVLGTVTDLDGRAVPGASVDVWQADAHGYYDVQRPDVDPEDNLRGLFSTDGGGRFWFRTVVPRYYPIPSDGTVGELLRATSRHPNRPAHIHFEISAPGMRTVTTHLFVDGTPYLDSDAVFGVKESLVREFTTVDDPVRAAEVGLPNPFRTVEFAVVLDRHDPIGERAR